METIYICPEYPSAILDASNYYRPNEQGDPESKSIVSFLGNRDPDTVVLYMVKI
jgi:hypothetical protein